MTATDAAPSADDPARFDVAVGRDGYAWWYLDALSDDGRSGLTIIAFVGSVFSPYYAHARHRARRRGEPGIDPAAHCAVNVAVYDRDRPRWSMTERSAHAVVRDARSFTIGPSRLAWSDDGATLVLTLDERGAPFPRAIRGTITVAVGARPAHRAALDVAGRHAWSVIAPAARVDVRLTAPRSSWSGPAYVDHNRGSAPLEHDFARWDWSRAHLADGRTAVIYDVERRAGGPLSIARWFDAAGASGPFDPPPRAALPRTGWRLAPTTRADGGTNARRVRSLEDGPFYARSVVEASWLGERAVGVHEHLSLDRFDQRWVRALLPFRMPRC